MTEATDQSAENEAGATAPAEQSATSSTDSVETKPDTTADAQAAPAEKADEAAGEESQPNVPESADGYDLALGEEIKGLNGEAISIDAENPLLKEFLADAHQNGRTQEQVTADLTRFAKYQAQMAEGIQADHRANMEAEFAKLGDKASDRLAGLHGFIKQNFSESKADAVIESIGSAEAFEVVESLIAQVNGSDEAAATPAGSEGKAELSLAQRMYGNTNA
jgi:hypothetical protein